MLKPSGHRLEDKHNLIIKKWAKVWKMKDAKALRKILELFEFNDKELTLARKQYESK